MLQYVVVRGRRLSRLADSGRPRVVGAKPLTSVGIVWWPATRGEGFLLIWGVLGSCSSLRLEPCQVGVRSGSVIEVWLILPGQGMDWEGFSR